MIPRSTNAEDAMSLVDAILVGINSFDASVVWPEVERLICIGIGDNFAATRSSDGSPWPARKDNKPHPLLRLTYAMFGAAVNTAGGGHISKITKDSLVTGIDIGVIKYARAQNLGYAPRNLPAREFMYITEDVIGQVGTALWDEAYSQLVGGGSGPAAMDSIGRAA